MFAIVAIVVILGILALVAVLAAGGKKEPAEDFGRFTRRPLLNKAEKQLLRDLDTVIPEIFGPEARILSQVSYGEFLKGEDKAAHARINQKRADFVVVDKDFEVVCVIEYQGAGHYGRGDKARENAEQRDRVKRAACASAKILLVEIPVKFSAISLKEKFEEHRSDLSA